MNNHSTKHGSPYDRGGADSYYQRPYDPHYYPEGTYKGTRIVREDMTPAEIEAYKCGWDENLESGNFKS